MFIFRAENLVGMRLKSSKLLLTHMNSKVFLDRSTERIGSIAYRKGYPHSPSLVKRARNAPIRNRENLNRTGKLLSPRCTSVKRFAPTRVEINPMNSMFTSGKQRIRWLVG